MLKKNYLYLGLGVIFIFVSICQIIDAQKGLDFIHLHNSNPPVTIIFPSDTDPASRPTVLMAHGFAGSSILMRGIALTLAHAGYTTISWDFQGHGENPRPMDSSSRSSDLLMDAESALAAAEAIGLVDAEQIATLGHSMGSGVALSYAMSHPDTDTTIAISPVNQSITSVLPHNLLIMAGSLEPQFTNNAEQILAQGGGQGGEIGKGTARKLVIIPNVEHISILFSSEAQLTARAWLDETFGFQPGARNYHDRRIIWYGLGIFGFILVANASINLISHPCQTKLNEKSLWIRVLALLIGGLVASISLWLVSVSGVRINQIFGLLVGGYVIIWFGVAGMISLLILRPDFSLSTPKELLIGLIAYASLWMGVGLLGNFIWLPWLLIPNRLLLWIPSAIILLPWFYSIGYATRNTKPTGLFGWWLYQVMTILVCLFLAIRFNPELGFLFIILPLVPVIIGLHMLVISSKHGVWAYASSGAMFTAWLILAVFPLQ